MRIGMPMPYSGGFTQAVRDIAEFETAGLDVVFVPLATLPDDVRASLGAMVPHPSRLGQRRSSALSSRTSSPTRCNGEVIRLDGAIRMAPR
jgi:hypothetical protein